MNRLVVVSNRVPARPAAAAQAGGLAVALEGLMQHRGGLWFGWSGRIGDSAALSHSAEGRVRFATLDLTAEEHHGYYNEFANGTLWPLLHSMPEVMTFDRRNAQTYRAVNHRFADTLLPLLHPGDLIWVHDYHLMTLPAALRARGVAAPIGFFLHIPFPAPDVLASLPEAPTLVRDLLTADLLGFQTANDADNFAEAAVRLAGAERAGPGWLLARERRVRTAVFPAEIDPQDFSAIAQDAWLGTPAERLRRSLHQGQLLILGVDRMDPTKGLLQRMAGFRRLLETREHWRRRITFLQIAAESRKDVPAYQDLRAEIEREAGSINSEFAEPDWAPLRLIARAGARHTIAGYMREARVGLVTPLRDGMNLVAKEYIAAQDPQDPGVLILSRFAGAARQLTSALLVNPHDVDEMADALDQALSMSLAERQARWREAWAALEDTSALCWGRAFVAALLRATARRRPLHQWPQPRVGAHPRPELRLI
jgi:trehalose 6-phosphate synthase